MKLHAEKSLSIIMFSIFAVISAQAVPPKVVKTIPENGQENVKPGIETIRIVFDQEMSSQGYSVCGGGPAFPEIIGKPKWENKMTFVMKVRLEPDHQYEMSVNCPSYQNFKNINGESAVICPLSFSTASKSQSEEKSSESASEMYTQEMHYEIDPNGLMNFYSPNHIKNTGDEPITERNFINSDFVNLTKMVDDKGRDIKFTADHEDDIYRYHVVFNEPVMPGEELTYTTYGTISGQIKSVPEKENTYMYYMKHYPAADRPTLRIETYLLPAGAKLLSKMPESMKESEKDGRIELAVKKVIPVNGSITTSFQYELKK